ncbi:hypothetical protein TVAG_221890 [Trichomonas vaginalis G3]|uniref:Uncharacterized protein n=1 Tax=Trichomonas vaginalis (strain ATCC PRA-98 / G3) TaxID=412133 RepID=A2E3E5_TRIV3|nr:hypothetical protein TVAGG3_0969740 [Trichomonas vaginalis G3]EAY12836.1 hypothetical protein TVAG_221890 [Trichomonas vaginalis G3]KAI5488507.1 hypothetical protein TVAGG3_0969740 [Trichomonas vaginalis G3]|eukprot:XP_001325059.1 hypothetical protein [Trichomonas vaginalis G3]
MTIVKSEYFSSTSKLTMILTRTTSVSDNHYYYVSTYQETYVVIPVIVETDVEIESFIEESKKEAPKDKKTTIYIAIGAALAFLIIISLILIFIIRKIRNSDDDDNSSTSELFIQSEAPKISQSMTTTSMTVDNPLFSTTVDQDDPFKLEFDSSSTIDEVGCENGPLTLSDSAENTSGLEEL